MGFTVVITVEETPFVIVVVKKIMFYKRKSIASI